MADEDKFSHLKSKISEVKRSKSKYKNHPYFEDFMREWKIILLYSTYALKVEIDLSSSDMWSLIQDSEYKKRLLEGNSLIL